MLKLAKTLKAWRVNQASLNLKSQSDSASPTLHFLSSLLLYYRVITYVWIIIFSPHSEKRLLYNVSSQFWERGAGFRQTLQSYRKTDAAPVLCTSICIGSAVSLLPCGALCALCWWHVACCRKWWQNTVEPRSELSHYLNLFIFHKTLYLINIRVCERPLQDVTSQTLSEPIISCPWCRWGLGGVKVCCESTAEILWQHRS